MDYKDKTKLMLFIGSLVSCGQFQRCLRNSERQDLARKLAEEDFLCCFPRVDAQGLG